jgi:hypothetical protein
MKVTQAAPCYRPVTIVLETQDDYDKFFSIVEQVAENRINHVPQVVRAAQELRMDLVALENAE